MRHNEATEEVARIGQDPDALEVFYRANADAIKRFIARRVDDPYLVADLTVEVFLAAIESARRAPVIRGKPIGWLYGVARNVVAAERRRSTREQRTFDHVAGRALIDGDDLAELEERVDAEAQARPLYLAMQELSEAERAVLELVALEGLTVSEAARVLDIRPVAARMRLHRARRLLKDRLAPTATQHFTPLSEVSS